MLENIKEINDGTKEGKVLMAALAHITSTTRTTKTPDEVLVEMSELARMMYNIRPVIIVKLKCCLHKEAIDKIRKNIEDQLKKGLLVIDDSFEYEIVYMEDVKNG